MKFSLSEMNVSGPKCSSLDGPSRAWHIVSFLPLCFLCLDSILLNSKESAKIAGREQLEELERKNRLLTEELLEFQRKNAKVSDQVLP